jgi:hypothetical protein
MEVILASLNNGLNEGFEVQSISEYMEVILASSNMLIN